MAACTRKNLAWIVCLRLALVALLGASGAPGHADNVGTGPVAAADEPRLMSIGDVKRLPDAALAGHGDVRVRGVVTWHDHESIAIQDPTGGIWVTEQFARRDGILAPDAPPLSPTVEPGLEIEVVGVPTRENLFSVMLMPRSLRTLGRQPLPPCRPATHGELFSGATDHLRVEIRGIVQGFRPVEAAPWWMLFVDGRPGEVGVLVPKDAFPNDPAEIVDAEILVRGVSGACYNYRSEFLSPRIHVNSRDDIVVERPAAVEPFEATKIPLADLAGYRVAGRGGHRTRVEGVATFVKPGECFYLQDGDIGVRVETRSTAPLRVGDRVEVAGFVTLDRRVAGIKEAVVNPLAGDAPPPPLATTIDAVRGRQGRDDGLLVTVPARLLDVHATDTGCPLSLADGDSTFEARLDGPGTANLLSLLPGSDLALTGIVKTDLRYDYRVRPSVDRLDLLLRAAGDVAIVRPPSWWTPRRLLQALAALAAVLLGALAWGVVLRRQVATRSAALASEMQKRRDAAVEFDATLRERNRLAANLHDTLLQTLGGIGYQLEACEATGLAEAPATKRHVDAAHRMVDNALAQLHESVWALRSLPLRNESFPVALRSLVARAAEGCDVRIGIDVQGPLDDVPDFVAGNLLLVIQEALTNAIRHGRAAAVTVDVRRDDQAGTIDLSVTDDGQGFVPGTQRGMDQGHFGLQGMRERVERLGGSLTIESGPGRGTSVRARVSRHALDADLA
ncbi:MAG: ATP-binding protein [Planctomycetia bacterium]